MLLGVIGMVCAVSLNGRTAVVEMTGYDPYDALRGRYLHLQNPDSDIPLEPGSVERYEALPWDNNDVYVILETDPDSGLERFSYATLDRPGCSLPQMRVRLSADIRRQSADLYLPADRRILFK